MVSKTSSAPTLEELVSKGRIAGALILKGNFTDEECLLIQRAYQAGFEHGQASNQDKSDDA